MAKGFPALFFSLGIVVILALAGCGSEPEKLVIEPEPAREEPVELAEALQELRDIKYSQSKNGKTQWELTAAGVQQALDGPTQLQRVKITYYAEGGKTTIVTGDAGAYNAMTNDAELYGNVLVNVSDGTSLSTDALRWDQTAELLIGRGDVRISRAGAIIEGRGFELSPEDESITLFEVSGSIRQGEEHS
jgi:LPS export ABC transporter protein LptC